MLQPARQDRKRRENPQALKDRKANLGRQLLYNLTKHCPGFDQKEVRRLCGLKRPPRTYVDRQRRNAKLFEQVVRATQEMTLEVQNYKEYLGNLASRLGREDWLLASLTYYLEYFRLVSVDLYGSVTGLMIYFGGVPPGWFAIEMDEFEIFQASEGDRRLLADRMKHRVSRLRD